MIHNFHSKTSYKTIFLGECGVGKSSIITYMQYGRFNSHTDSTIGMAYSRYNNLEKNISLDIWDTAGQERFFSIIPMYLRNISVAIFVYDISNAETFEKIQNRWYPFVLRTIDPNTLPIFVLVENKIDLTPNPVVTRKAQEWAKSANMIFAQVSPRAKIGIDNMFNEIVNRLYVLPPTDPIHPKCVDIVRSNHKEDNWFIKLFKCKS